MKTVLHASFCGLLAAVFLSASMTTAIPSPTLPAAADGLNGTSPLLPAADQQQNRPCDEVHQRLFPSTTTPSSNETAPRMQKHEIMRVGAYIPQCNKTTGQFSAQQCHGSTGYCWCAHPITNARLTEKQRPWIKTENVAEQNCEEIAAGAVASGTKLNLDDKETTDMKNFAVQSQENVVMS